jgi:hypothetical protein
MRIALRTLAVILAFAAVCGSAQSQKKPPLTNEDIVRLVQDKFADSTIVKAIEANHTAFDLSASALLMLRDSGVSQTVIEAMLSAETPKGANAPPQRAATAAKPAQASSPQSQQSVASAPSSPAESQAQRSLPCSDAPVLNGGKQSALPPCPDPPAASPPADSAPTQSLSPAESLIERAREAAFEFSAKKLPNFICEEFMRRFDQRGRNEQMPLDTVSAEIIYRDAQESYRNVKINGQPTDEDLKEIGGSWSTGEFASTLVDLFHPDTGAQFRSGGASPIPGFSGAQVYDFQVRGENSHWAVTSDSQTVNPAYKGSVWVDPKTARVLRIEMQARNLPPDFPMDTVESAVDYSYITISGTSFLLPIHAESLGCERSTSNCSHNIIDFRNYHELQVDFRLVPSQ